uniref:Uncharacterized protein n=1 Tax=Oryza punctata TaxID=4537 RepID=A0A0E0KPE9_ORYPU
MTCTEERGRTCDTFVLPPVVKCLSELASPAAACTLLWATDAVRRQVEKLSDMVPSCIFFIVIILYLRMLMSEVIQSEHWSDCFIL